jgi:hypothetical protein
VAVATRRQLPTNPTYRVRDRDLAEVTVDIGNGGVAEGDGELLAGLGYESNGMRYSFEYARDVRMPSVRKHLVTTRVRGGKASWYSSLAGLGEDGVPIYGEGQEPVTFDPGQRVRRDYLHAAFVPSAEGSHFPGGFMIANVHPVGSSTNPIGVDHAAVTGTMTLLRDGVQVATAGELVVNVPDLTGTATYTLRAEAEHRLPWLRYATRMRAEWTFRATEPTSEDGSRLPLLTPRVSGAFDSWGYAAAGTRQPLTVDVRGVGGLTGKIREPEVWISYDDGVTWRTLTVERAGTRWRFAPKLPAVSSYGTLRIRAGDDKGNMVDVLSYRAFGIRAG